MQINPTLESQELLDKLIRNYNEAIDSEMECVYNEEEKLLKLAKDYRRNELAEELAELNKKLPK